MRTRRKGLVCNMLILREEEAGGNLLIRYY